MQYCDSMCCRLWCVWCVACTPCSTHTATWNTCCHNTALIMTTYFYWLYLQKR